MSEHPPTAPAMPMPQITPRLFIDILRMRYEFKDKETAKAVHAAIYTAINDTEFLQSESNAKPPGAKLHLRITIPDLDEKHFPVLTYYTTNYAPEPDKKDYAAKYMLLTMHPDDMTLDDFEEMHATLGLIIEGGWQEFIENGKVTKLEVSIDLKDVPLNSIHPLPSQSKTRSEYRNGENVQTIYFNKAGADQFIVYDRGAKREEKGQMDLAGTCTRVERKIRSANRRLHELGELKNPFKALRMLDMPALGPNNGPTQKDGTDDHNSTQAQHSKDYIWTLFVDSVAQRGLDSALKILPEARRTQYAKHISLYPKEWWKPDEIWKSWPEYLSKKKFDDPKYFAIKGSKAAEAESPVAPLQPSKTKLVFPLVKKTPKAL